jgi:uncharacterized Zn-binding protein involved in type VI secretion
MSNVQLSRKLAESRDTTGQLRKILREHSKDIQNMMPAKVVSYDRGKNRATVEILVNETRTNGELVERAQLASVPVVQMGSGGFVLSFPMNAGDLGWIKANDRDISTFLQNLSMSSQNTFRTHSFSDGVFFPDNVKTPANASGDDSQNVVLQSSNGSVKISLSGEDIVIQGVENILLKAKKVDIDAEETTVKKNLTIEGDVTFQGSAVAEDGFDVSGGFTVSSGSVNLGGSRPVAGVGDTTSDGATITSGSSTVTIP